MKKIILIIVIISCVFFGFGYYFMQKSSKLITQNEESIYEIVESNGSNSIPSDKEFQYYFENMDLKQDEHIIINNCLQNIIINENDNNTTSKCDDIILDAVLEKMENNQFIKAIIGNMISYKSSICLKQDFYKTVFPSNDHKTKISSKLIFAFINRYRDAEKLKAEFNENKDFFFDYVSKDLYQKLFEKTLNNFLDSYAIINKQEDKEAYYKKIYYEAETKNKHDEFWYITFWKRRELEKNDQMVYDIINEIKEYYSM